MRRRGARHRKGVKIDPSGNREGNGAWNAPYGFGIPSYGENGRVRFAHHLRLGGGELGGIGARGAP